MYMVFDAIYDDGFAINIVDQVADYTEKRGFPLLFNYRPAILYCEDGLDINLMIGIGHV